MENNSILDCSDNISKDVQAVFFLNPNGISRKLATHQLGCSREKLSIPEQIHGNKVDWVNSPGEYSALDGLITQNPEILLTLKVADCVPVFLYDPCKKMIALVHSGWRGIASGIMGNTIELMQNKGSKVQDIRVYLGPAIGKCCYEVNVEVAIKFKNDAKVKLNNGKWKVDLHEQIRKQLVEVGIPDINIVASNICTYESLECHSYRRDGEKSGRMFAFFGLI